MFCKICILEKIVADIIFICTFLFHVRKIDTHISVATMTTQKEGALPVLWFLVAQYDTHLSSGKGDFLSLIALYCHQGGGGGRLKSLTGSFTYLSPLPCPGPPQLRIVSIKSRFDASLFSPGVHIFLYLA